MRIVVFVTVALLVRAPCSAQTLESYSESEREFVSAWVESAQAASRLMPIAAEHLEAWRSTVQSASNSHQLAEASRRLGFNYYGREVGDWSQAISLLESAASLEPSNPRVLEDLGRALVIVGRSSEGLAILRRADTGNARRFIASFTSAEGR